MELLQCCFIPKVCFAISFILRSRQNKLMSTFRGPRECDPHYRIHKLKTVLGQKGSVSYMGFLCLFQPSRRRGRVRKKSSMVSLIVIRRLNASTLSWTDLVVSSTFCYGHRPTRTEHMMRRVYRAPIRTSWSRRVE